MKGPAFSWVIDHPARAGLLLHVFLWLCLFLVALLFPYRLEPLLLPVAVVLFIPLLPFVLLGLLCLCVVKIIITLILCSGDDDSDEDEEFVSFWLACHFLAFWVGAIILWFLSL